MEKQIIKTRKTLKISAIFIPFLGFIWAVYLFLFFEQIASNLQWIAWLKLVPPVIFTVFYTVAIISIINISYEITSCQVIKRRGNKIIRSINLSEVQGFVKSEMIKLVLVDGNVFLFRGIGNKSDKMKLLDIFRNLKIKEMQKDKIKFIQIFGSLVGLILLIHFLISILMWLLYFIYCVRINRVAIDWPMLLHAVPAILFFLLSIIIIRLAWKKKRSAIIWLGLTFTASFLCFSYEHHHDFYQWNKGNYCTWWLYGICNQQEESDISDYTSADYRYGYIDATGNIVIEPEYDYAEKFSEGLACVGYKMKKEEVDEEIVQRQSSKKDLLDLFPSFENDDYVSLYGFINKQGYMVIEPKFDEAEDFSEGLAMVIVEGKNGYIEKSGKYQIRPQYNYSSVFFSEGFAVVRKEDKSFFINKNGDSVFTEKYEYAKPFTESLAAVEKNGKWGYINHQGQMIIEPSFDRVQSFSEGLAPVQVNGKWGFIDQNGVIHIDSQYEYATGFSDGLAAVAINSKWGIYDKWGCIDKTGAYIIEPDFYFPPRFYGQYGYVVYCTGWGYRTKCMSKWIDRSGKVITKPYFDQVYRFSEGLAPVQVNGKWGFIDQNGTIVIEPQFDSAGMFSEGLCVIGIKAE